MEGRQALTKSDKSLRKFSLVTTPPVDYDPPAINYAELNLTEIANHHRTDKGEIDHNYTQVYEKYFLPLRYKKVSILELGVACGCSLKMWANYFTDATVVGIDIREECANLCKSYGNIHIIVHDATKLLSDKEFDIIIDDASHNEVDIYKAFNNLWPKVKKGGYYCIEDYRKDLVFDKEDIDFIDQQGMLYVVRKCAE